MSKIVYKVAKNAEAVIKMIDSTGEHYAKARRSGQIAAVNVLIHAAKCGDYTLANRLVSVIKSGDAKPLVKWFVTFGGLEVGEKEVDGVPTECFVGWKGKQYIKDNLDKAKATMFWDFKEKSPYAGLDLHEQLGKLIDKSQKALDKVAEAEKQGIDGAELRQLKELVQVDSTELKGLIAVYNSSNEVVQ